MAKTLFAISYKVVFLIDEEVGDGRDSDVAERDEVWLIGGIVKHVENLSDEKTIQAIQENPYMQYLLGLSKFTEKPVFVPELFVLIRKRLDQDFFSLLLR